MNCACAPYSRCRKNDPRPDDPPLTGACRNDALMRTCSEPGGCDSCPNPPYCAGLRIGADITTPEAEAEVERLREERGRCAVDLRAAKRRIDALEAEVERLLTDREDARAEVDRLREEYEVSHRGRLHALEEVERLRTLQRRERLRNGWRMP